MWTGLGIELNSEVKALKLLSVNNGVSEAKCHVRSCSSNKMQTNGSFFFFVFFLNKGSGLISSYSYSCFTFDFMPPSSLAYLHSLMTFPTSKFHHLNLAGGIIKRFFIVDKLSSFSFPQMHFFLLSTYCNK